MNRKMRKGASMSSSEASFSAHVSAGFSFHSGVGRQCGDNVVDAALDPAVEIAGLEPRSIALEMTTLETVSVSVPSVADLDAHSMLLLPDEKKDARCPSRLRPVSRRGRVRSQRARFPPRRARGRSRTTS
jgi:hypothetical protein